MEISVSSVNMISMIHFLCSILCFLFLLYINLFRSNPAWSKFKVIDAFYKSKNDGYARNYVTKEEKSLYKILFIPMKLKWWKWTNVVNLPLGSWLIFGWWCPIGYSVWFSPIRSLIFHCDYGWSGLWKWNFVLYECSQEKLLYSELETLNLRLEEEEGRSSKRERNCTSGCCPTPNREKNRSAATCMSYLGTWHLLPTSKA